MRDKAVFIIGPGKANCRASVADSGWTDVDLTSYVGKFVEVESATAFLACMATTTGTTPSETTGTTVTTAKARQIPADSPRQWVVTQDRPVLALKSSSGTITIEVSIASP